MLFQRGIKSDRVIILPQTCVRVREIEGLHFEWPTQSKKEYFYKEDTQKYHTLHSHISHPYPARQPLPCYVSETARCTNLPRPTEEFLQSNYGLSKFRIQFLCRLSLIKRFILPQPMKQYILSLILSAINVWTTRTYKYRPKKLEKVNH
jgi:hypothetical protein